MAVKKKPISLKEDLFNYAECEANKFFQGNFSMFIGYLISCHREGIATNKSECSDNYIKNSEETNKIIDDIDRYFAEK